MSTTETLNERSEVLRAAIAKRVGGKYNCYSMHTGGGCYVLAVQAVRADGTPKGRELWLMREDEWVLGFYDFGADPEDEGVCMYLLPRAKDDPEAVATEVARLVERVA